MSRCTIFLREWANLEATIRRAVDLGINHIETARGYGSSEMQLGRILQRFRATGSSCRRRSRPWPTLRIFFAPSTRR